MPPSPPRRANSKHAGRRKGNSWPSRSLLRTDRATGGSLLRMSRERYDSLLQANDEPFPLRPDRAAGTEGRVVAAGPPGPLLGVRHLRGRGDGRLDVVEGRPADRDGRRDGGRTLVVSPLGTPRRREPS